MPLTSVHLTNAWHPTSGGIRTFYLALLDAGNREQRRVVVIAPGKADSCEPVGRFGRIHFVKAPAAPAFDRRYRLIYPHRYLPGIGRRVAGILQEEQPDIVEISDKYSLPYLAAMLRSNWLPRVPRPVLVGLSCERFDDNMASYLSRGDLAKRFTQWYIRHIYGPPFDVHVANSHYTAAELREALPDRPDGFVRVCPMGVDVSAFSPARRSRATRAQLLRQLGGEHATKLLLYAGRLSPEKNLGLLVESLRALVADGGADFRLVIAGDGPQREWCRRQAVGSLEGRILLCGNLDRVALAACYASCDVFVHPNPREPFGIGPLEAMASGIPVVVPNSGGVLSYATDANAWIAAPTAHSFSAAIRAASACDLDRTQAARATAQQFRWDVVTRQYFELYDEIHRQFMGPRASVHADGPSDVSPSAVAAGR